MANRSDEPTPLPALQDQIYREKILAGFPPLD